MTIHSLIQAIQPLNVKGNTEQSVSALVLDSRVKTSEGVFFAVNGTQTNGHDFIDMAISNGAVAVVCSDMPAELNPTVTYIQVDDVSQVIGVLASVYYGNPSSQMKVVGVTGTNGKTTVATVLYDLFTALGHPCGLVSTVENKVNGTIIPSTHTTPNPIALQALFAQMLGEGCDYVFMEVSSHAVHQHRIAGTTFTGGIFTNITHDHLDYHKTFDEYIRVKKKFFDNLGKNAFAITNLDDKRGAVMLQNTRAQKLAYSLRVPADFKGKVLENGLTGLLMQINNQEVHFRMIGLFNAYNLLAVYGAATALGEDSLSVLTSLSMLRGAPGRFETYRSDHHNILGIVDYAHTPDALQNVLSTIKQFGQQANIITVVGCGGDRDKTKRPEMARVACELSNTTIITSDNPRTENPEAILDDMINGISPAHYRKMIRISDRREAIKTACNLARPHDVILVAGKGHENYQEINGIKHHFDDRKVLLEMFKLLEK